MEVENLQRIALRRCHPQGRRRFAGARLHHVSIRSRASNFFTRIAYGIYRLIYGEYPPGKAIGYIWANRLPIGEVVESAYTSRLKLFALKSGDELAGSWSEERRNIPADFRMAFPGEPLPRRARVAIMVDSDNTQGEALSWFDAISLDVAVN